MCHESSRRSAAGVLAAVPAGPPRPLRARASLFGRVVAERLLDELVLVDGTSAPAAPQSPLLGVDSSAQMVEALLRDLGRDVRCEEVGDEQSISDERVDAGRGASRCTRPHRRRDAVAPAAVSRRGVFVEADAFAQAGTRAESYAADASVGSTRRLGSREGRATRVCRGEQDGQDET